MIRLKSVSQTKQFKQTNVVFDHLKLLALFRKSFVKLYRKQTSRRFWFGIEPPLKRSTNDSQTLRSERSIATDRQCPMQFKEFGNWFWLSEAESCLVAKDGGNFVCQ
jgi:hypothetical protein